MKRKIIFILLLFSSSSIVAQKSIIRKTLIITKAEFNDHIPVIDLIVKSSTKRKSHGIIKLKTSKKTFVLKDDGEFLQYVYEGDLKGYPIAVVHEIESNSEEYYFINKISGLVDTLLNRPIFYSDHKSFISLEGSGTDITQRIQVGKINDDNSITKQYVILPKRPYIPASYIFWHDSNTIFVSTNSSKFYKLKLK
jgi:hypothetical protein